MLARFVFLMILALGITLFSDRNCMADTGMIVSPADGSVIDTRSPLITVSTGDRDIDRESIRILINGGTPRCQTFFFMDNISVQLLENLPTGSNTVEVSYKTIQGDTREHRWSFEIAVQCQVQSINHNGEMPLSFGEDLEVRVKGKTGARATFSVGNTLRNIAMEEVSPGEYVGKYRVRNEDYAIMEPLTISMEFPDGTSCRQKAETPVSLHAMFFRLKILSPANKALVPRRFAIKGITRPNVRVHFSIKMGFKQFGSFITATSPESGGIYAQSDDKGHFTREMGFPLKMKGFRATIKAFAVDNEGNKSLDDEITIYLDTNPEKNGKTEPPSDK